MHLKLLPGGPALSPFRLEKLVESLPDASILDAQQLRPVFLHFVQSAQYLDETALELCQRLLSYAGSCSGVDDAGTALESVTLLTVVPRFGTISPWSTKATDIFHVCGLESVLRVERGVMWQLDCQISESDALADAKRSLARSVCDPMTESILPVLSDASRLFEEAMPQPFSSVALGTDPVDALGQANAELGLALSPEEIEYLIEQYQRIGRDPTDVELMMFAQANSEHCRHKIFNASWHLDNERKDASLFGMIRETHAENPAGTLVAYDDNAAVLNGHDISLPRLKRTITPRRFHHLPVPQPGLAVKFVMKVQPGAAQNRKPD